MIGERIREFEIQSELGAGGYGAVYRAHDTNVDRDVAIKVILPQYADNPDFKQRFETEARLVAQLESRQIVPLYQYWQDEKGAFLVMRLIRGGSLRRIMAKQGALSLSQTVRIASDIAEALAVAHENDVVHRDLKPENILIDERGNAYLTDFGIAKVTTQKEHVTEANALVGTWAYLSPEQIHNSDVSPQTDIYAFGILLYEMLAGKHPFQDASSTAMLVKHMQEALPDIYEKRPDLPRKLNDIIQEATEKDAEDRYESTLELIADLKAISNESAAVASVKVQQVKKKTPNSPEERNRQAMLENVRRFWVEGVLENSLHDAAMIDLGLKAESGAVDNPWDTLLRTPAGDEHVVGENIISVFERMNGKLLILGDPGSGKTTTLLSLARELLNRAELDDAHAIPVVFNLSSWSEKQLPIGEWLVEELNSKYQVPRKVGEKWIADEELLLLLDGLDEVAEAARNACVDAINVYREEHGFVDVVVCSRIKDYEALEGQLRLKGAIVIQALSDEQIVSYLDSLGADVSVVRELIARDVQLRGLAQSPLMLSIMILAYRGRTANDIPDFDDVDAQREHLFDVYVQRMFERRIGEKVYDPQQTFKYLSWLGSKMREQALSVFHIEELQPNVIPEAMRSAFYLRVRVIHIAVTIVNWLLFYFLFAIGTGLSPLVLGIGGILSGAWIGWAYSGNEWKTITNHVMITTLTFFPLVIATYLATSFSVALLVGILSAAGVAASSWIYAQVQFDSGGDKDTIPLLETISLDWSLITPRFLIVAITSGLSGAALIIAWGSTQEVALPQIIISSVSSAILAIVYFCGVKVISGTQVSMRVRPNSGIHRTLRNANIISVFTSINAIVLWIVCGLIMGLPLWQGFIAGLGYGLGFAGYAVWTIKGGIGVYRHWMLRSTLSNRGYLPSNLAEFLDYAASLVLMRKVGGGYIFIHRYLLEYFADMQTGKVP